MSDTTTPTTTGDPPAATEEEAKKALDAFAARVQGAFIEETEKHKAKLVQMGATDDAVVKQLSEEIIERMALLSHFFGIEYGAFFPLNLCEYLLLAKWQGDAPRLSALIGTEEKTGDAKSRLDALYDAAASA